MQYILYCFHNDTSLENNSQNGHSNESNKWIEDGHKSCQIKSSWLYVYLLYDKLSIYLFFDTFPWVLPMLLILGFCCCSWFYLRLVYLKTATQFDETLHLPLLFSQNLLSGLLNWSSLTIFSRVLVWEGNIWFEYHNISLLPYCILYLWEILVFFMNHISLSEQLLYKF